MPLVDVVVPCYNREDLVGETIESVLEQSFSDYHVYLVDDGSTDGTLQILRRYEEQDQRITVIAKANGGCSSALNAGIRAGASPWIARISSDDLWHPEKLQRQVELVQRRPQARFVHTAVWWIDTAGRVTGSKIMKPWNWGRTRPHHLVRQCRICSETVMFHRELIDEAGYFDEGLRMFEDLDMWLRMGLRHRLHYLPRRLVYYRVHPGNITRQWSEGAAQYKRILDKALAPETRDATLRLPAGPRWLRRVLLCHAYALIGWAYRKRPSGEIAPDYFKQALLEWRWHPLPYLGLLLGLPFIEREAIKLGLLTPEESAERKRRAVMFGFGRAAGKQDSE